MTTASSAATTTSSPSTSSPKRGDIHGLRGLAIALVVVYHLFGQGRVSGGVDVFLMVSAYLLTGSLARRGEDFRFAEYAIRRFRRLIPQAVLVILATLVAGFIILPPSRWPTLLDHAQASLFYQQNWKLIDAATNYTAGAHGQSSPLQHFWSLSMQGQVFVGWPLVLLLALALRRLLKVELRVLLGVLFGAILIASFTYAVLAVRQNPAAAYFNTFARLWEFALPSLLALAPRPRLTRPVAAVLGWAGVSAIVVGGLVVGRFDFPGPAALWPSLAACAVVVAGDAPTGGHVEAREQAGHWLGGRVIGWVADRAYGIYLWHWPVYVFWLETFEGRLGAVGAAAVIALSLLLADVSTRLVERRFNVTVLQSKRGGVALIVASTMIVIGAIEGWAAILDRDVSRVQSTNPPGARVVTPGQPAPTPTATRSRGIAPGDSVVGNDWPAGPGPCPPGSPHAVAGAVCAEHLPPDGRAPTRTVVMIGDSHSFQWSTVMTAMAAEDDWHFLSLTRARCRVTLPNPLSDEACVGYSQAVVDHVVALKPDVVFNIGTRAQPNGPELPVDTWPEAARPILDAGIPIVNMRDTPRWPFNMPECVQRFGEGSERCLAPLPDKLASQSPLTELSRTPGMLTMDLTEHVCTGGTCRGVIGDVYVYMDDNHLSRTYVTTLREEFAAQWYALFPR